MKRRLLFLISTMLSIAPVVGLSQRADLFSEDFDGRSSDFTEKIDKHKLVEIERDAGPDGSDAVKVSYRPTDRGSERISMYLQLSKAVEEASLSYDLKFSTDFEFVRGGKLPGLCPDNPVSGGNPVSENQWSARLMWNRNDSLITYLYHQDQPKSTGDAKSAEGFKFERGEYHTVTIYTRLNSDEDQADGLVEVYIDGKKVVEHRDLRFRGETGRDTLISNLMFNTFHGGSDPSWAPSETVFAFFDNFEVHSGKVIREPKN
ncbi:MAG: polysaccharide lyase [Verrucomicrobiota bacterium]